jgi:hypothetical protein
MKRSATPLPGPEEFARFLAGVTMLDLRIVRCEANLPGAPPPGQESIGIEFGEDAQLVRSTKTEAVVRASYGVRLVEADAPDQEVARLLVVYEVTYATEREMTPETFEVFRARSLRLHTIPFAREWLRETSARMGLEPVLLPLALAHPAAVPSAGRGKKSAPRQRR